MKTDTRLFISIRNVVIVSTLFFIITVPVVVAFSIFYSAVEYIQNDKENAVEDFKNGFSAELIDSMTEKQKEILAESINDEILSLDYEDDQKMDSVYYDGQEYFVYISYDETNNKTNLVYGESDYTHSAIMELDASPYTLVTNQTLPLSLFRSTLIFSIDNVSSWCEGNYDECGEYSHQIERDTDQYAGIWTYDIAEEELKQIDSYTLEEKNSRKEYTYLEGSPIVLVSNTAAINGYETAYKVSKLDIRTGDISIIFDDPSI